MLTTRFSVQGTSLKLLRLHEQGVINRIHTACETTVQKLKGLGLIPGCHVSLERQSPRFIIRAGNDRHALNDMAISAIYVRIIEH